MVNNLLKNKSDAEKANIKGESISKLKIKGKKERKDIDVEIVSTEAINGGVQVLAKSWDKNGKQIGFGKDGSVDIERFVIKNPPILVADANGDIIREWTDEKTGTLKQRRLREDPEEVLLRSLEDTIKVKKEKFGAENIIEGKIGNTTSTFYPAAGENSPVDGFMFAGNSSPGVSWSTLYTSAGGNNNGASATAADDRMSEIRAWTGTDNWRRIGRSVYGFDTSSIGSDTVSSATFSLYGSASSDGFGSQSVVVDRMIPSDTSTVTTSDYAVANWDVTKQSDTEIAVTSWNASGYNDFALNSTGIGNINGSGYSWYGLRQDMDFDNNPSWSSAAHTYVEGNFADETGTANDPKLVVEHAPAPTFIPKVMIF